MTAVAVLPTLTSYCSEKKFRGCERVVRKLMSILKRPIFNAKMLSLQDLKRKSQNKIYSDYHEVYVSFFRFSNDAKTRDERLFRAPLLPQE